MGPLLDDRREGLSKKSDDQNKIERWGNKDRELVTQSLKGMRRPINSGEMLNSYDVHGIKQIIKSL